MNGKPEIRAIVFDFDGVVVESGDVKTDAFVALFAAYGAEVQQRVLEHHLANLGVSRYKKFDWIYEHVLHQPLDDAGRHALGEAFSALVLEKVIAAPFVPGAREALDTLGPRYPLFVASGTPQHELDQIVERRGIRDRFREVHGTPAEKPAILASILARHRLAPDEVLFVGDGLSDYEAAAKERVRFLARDSANLHDRWCSLGVVRCEDLIDLPARVQHW